MTPCVVEDCPRDGLSEYWGVLGPVVCVPHRAEWAADHARDISEDECLSWFDLHLYDWPDGTTSSTWPFNFTTPTRPTRAELAALEAKASIERRERDRQRLENSAAARPGFRRFGFNK